MRTAHAAAAVFLLAASPAPAQDAPGLSPEAKAAAENLLRASWNGAAGVNGFSFKARAVPLFSTGFIEAVTHATQLPKEQQAALAHLAEVVIPADGWFMGARLAPGTYHLGLHKAPRYLRFVLRDAAGTEVAAEPIWLEGRRTERPTSSVSSSGGVVVAQLAVGDGIAFDWRYLPVERHDAVAAASTTVTEGVVTLVTDIEHQATVAALAKELAAAVPGHAGLLGVPVPKEPLYLYLYRDKQRYQQIDAMLSGGRFADHGAVTAALTKRSYIWYVPWSTAIAFDDHGATLSMRALCTHELHHQIAARYFRSIDAWPKWIGEGLAELGALRALEAADPAAGTAYAAQSAQVWRNARRIGQRPAMEDFLADDQTGGIKVWYAGALQMARELERRKPGGLAALLPFFEGEPVYRTLRRRALGEIERGWGPLPTLWEACNAAVDSGAAGPAVVWGSADAIPGGWRCVADTGGSARVVLPEQAAGPDAEVSGEFALHHAGNKQADIYFGYRMGRDRGRFVKVAILPAQIVLMHWGPDGWRTWGRVQYERELTPGNPKKPTWYDFKVVYTAATRKIRVDYAGGRWAEWIAPEYVPIAGTQAAIGCYDSVVFFRNVRAK